MNRPKALGVLRKNEISACENVPVPEISWGIQDPNDDTNSSSCSEDLRITEAVTTSIEDCDDQYEAALSTLYTSSSSHYSTARSGQRSHHGDEDSPLVSI